MLDNSVLPREILRHGAYVCLRLADGADPRAVAGAAIEALAEKLGLVGLNLGAAPEDSSPEPRAGLQLASVR